MSSIREDIADELAKRSDDDEVRKLIVIGIGNVLFRLHRKGEDWRVVFTASRDAIHHIVDWLTSAVMDKDEWLQRVDQKGRPMKLAKMHSIEQLVGEADKAFAKKLQKVASVAVSSDDEIIHFEHAESVRLGSRVSRHAALRWSGIV